MYADSPGELSFRPHRGSLCGFSCGPRTCKPGSSPSFHIPRTSAICACPIACHNERLNDATDAEEHGKFV